MAREKIIYHLKKRWEIIHKIEIEELKKTSLNDKFEQTVLLFNSINFLNIGRRKLPESDIIKERWSKLKDIYNASK